MLLFDLDLPYALRLAVAKCLFSAVEVLYEVFHLSEPRAEVGRNLLFIFLSMLSPCSHRWGDAPRFPP